LSNGAVSLRVRITNAGIVLTGSQCFPCRTIPVGACKREIHPSFSITETVISSAYIDP
jgi:hypothetical protein